jgi:hypothetical protein
MGRQQLWLMNDQREDVQPLQNPETIQMVLAHEHTEATAHAVTELQLTVMIADETEWRILVTLRDATNYATWSKHTEGWDTLEDHQDPGCCAGVLVDSVTGKVTEIDLFASNLSGGESRVSHVRSRSDATKFHFFW